jgi:hypothetical protein
MYNNKWNGCSSLNVGLLLETEEIKKIKMKMYEGLFEMLRCPDGIS